MSTLGDCPSPVFFRDATNNRSNASRYGAAYHTCVGMSTKGARNTSPTLHQLDRTQTDRYRWTALKHKQYGEEK